VSDLKSLIDRGVNEPLSQSNPYVLMFYTYLDLEQYENAENLLSVLKTAYNQQGIDQVISQLKSQIEVRRAMSAAPPVAPQDSKPAKGK
ncbi:MAG: hypothetical protein AABZ41_01985, partial [Bacteroidota bacterium]